jgi:hypothetical protein
VKRLSNDKLLERMAEELIHLHLETGIDLAYWETGLEIVERFYNVRATVEILGKKEK